MDPTLPRASAAPHIRRALALVAALSASWLVSCESGRILQEDEEGIVGSRRAGITTYDRLVRDATSNLLAKQSARETTEGKWTVVFLGLENASTEELRDFQAALYDNIEAVIHGEGTYTLVDRSFVEVAMREVGARNQDQLFLKRYKQAFLAELAEGGILPDYFLRARTTSKTSKAGSTRDRTYQLTLKLINASSGETVAVEQATLRKRYEN